MRKRRFSRTRSKKKQPSILSTVATMTSFQSEGGKRKSRKRKTRCLSIWKWS